MKYLLAVAIGLLVMVDTPAQQTETKPVTVTSYVYGNRFCARVPITATILSMTFGGYRGEELPGPTGSCVTACTTDGERFLAVMTDDKGYTYKAKDTAKLRDQCGKKVTVTGKATPSKVKEDQFDIEIDSVKPYIEPEKKVLPESNVVNNTFGKAAVIFKAYVLSLYNKEGKSTIAMIDKQKAEAKGLIRTTADQKTWDLLNSYNFHVRRFLFLGSMPDGDGKKTAAGMQPMLEKCGDYASDNLNARKAPAVTECTKLP